MTKAIVTIGGRPVAYLKRVAHGAPMVVFAAEGEGGFKYDAKLAESWVKTCLKYFSDVEMVLV